VWLGGQAVGAWSQRRDGEIAYRLLEDVAAADVRRIEAAVRRLRDWMAGMRVTAIEPVDEMSAALPSGVNALAGTAEAIPLPSSCADGVVVAQAWHWFEAQRALREIHRVLRELGCLIIVYNRRDMEDPVQRQIEALVAPHRGDAPSYRSHPFDGAPLFSPAGNIQTRWTHTADVAERVASISFIAALPDAERERVLDQARALGEAELPYVCEAEAWMRLTDG